jgi:predicted dithiol-disulfide oxidoreductase (DUF899 family)
MWPNESAKYRDERNALLEKEAQLRQLSEDVAAMRRALPPGGELQQNYKFVRVRDHVEVKFSQLFEKGKDTLFAYSLMYRPGGKPCPMCVSLLDGLDMSVPQLERRINIAVFARATPTQLLDLANHRGWENLALYSTAGNSYNTDYHGEDEKGSQLPMINVFRKTGSASAEDGSGETIRHFWSSELFFHKVPGWEHQPRHADSIWPLWNVLDLTPAGRGKDWYPVND